VSPDGSSFPADPADKIKAYFLVFFGFDREAKEKINSRDNLMFQAAFDSRDIIFYSVPLQIS
jgi:hypothetical protein